LRQERAGGSNARAEVDMGLRVELRQSFWDGLHGLWAHRKAAAVVVMNDKKK
jgi:hypothetical protein